MNSYSTGQVIVYTKKDENGRDRIHCINQAGVDRFIGYSNPIDGKNPLSNAREMYWNQTLSNNN